MPDKKRKNILFYLPVYVREYMLKTADLGLFSIIFFKELFTPPMEWTELRKQAFYIGNNSLSLVGITGFIMGLVLTMQSEPTLKKFGAEFFLPSMVAISIVREIGPVVTALICAGKISSGIGAELGSMRVTEQIDSMEVSGANPYNYLMVTRVLASTFMIPLLVIYADVIGIFGSYVAVNISGEVSLRLFFSESVGSLAFSDIFPATIKTFLFGFIIGIVGCFEGFNARNGTQGVGRASNAAVVTASLLIFIVDMLAVQFTQILGIE